ncbi:MAG: hypothetical protein IJX33_04285 [Akkermansia sp.]|nr:hypothetical protein [Akkermansia sp.]
MLKVLCKNASKMLKVLCKNASKMLKVLCKNANKEKNKAVNRKTCGIKTDFKNDDSDLTILNPDAIFNQAEGKGGKR